MAKQLLCHVKKQRHLFAIKGLHSQNYGFSRSHGWMWEVDHKESWVLKNWCSRIVVLEKTLESPLDSKEVSLEYSLEGLMLKLKLQYFGHLMQRAGSLEKTPILGKMRAGGEGGDRGWDGWMASLTQWTWFWANSGRCWRTGKPCMLQSMGSQWVGHDWATEQWQQPIPSGWLCICRILTFSYCKIKQTEKPHQTTV